MALKVEDISFEAGYITVRTNVGPPTRYPIADILRALDIPDLSATQITSGELDMDRVPDKGITYEKLSSVAVNYLLETVEAKAELAGEMAGETEKEVRASEKYGVANIEIR